MAEHHTRPGATISLGLVRCRIAQLLVVEYMYGYIPDFGPWWTTNRKGCGFSRSRIAFTSAVSAAPPSPWKPLDFFLTASSTATSLASGYSFLNAPTSHSGVLFVLLHKYGLTEKHVVDGVSPNDPSKVVVDRH